MTTRQRQKVAGPWMNGTDGSDQGQPVMRSDIGGPEEEIGITLAVVYPTCVYVRSFMGEEWRRVKDRKSADRSLRRAGWVLT